MSKIKKIVKKTSGTKRKKATDKEIFAKLKKSMSKKEMSQMMGSPTVDADGVVMHKKGGMVKKANGGRMSRVGLSPAEESRAGVMSEAARRRNMPRAGAMSFRPGGGMVEKGKVMQGYKKGGQV
jgi:hypothetical protein